MDQDDVAVLIPAYQPDATLRGVVTRLQALGFRRVVVVNDGSTRPAALEVLGELRRTPGVTVLEHAVNMGQGAAVKTGLNHLYSLRDPGIIGVITMDADGQHSPDDALALAEALRRDRQTLLIGGRKFDAKVPLRSRFGNVLTALIGKVFLGLTVSDTQSGMRGIPIQHVPALLGIRYDRFEFAIGLLIQCRRCRIPVRETPIQTIYIAGNASSHFNPLLDSMRIYFVLSRYIFATFAVVAVDYAIFIAAFPLTGSVVASTYAGRCVALFVQYFAGKNWVFYSKDSMTRSFPRYVLLVAVSGFISAALIRTLTEWTGIGVVLAKVVAELVLFPFNFTVQKELVFPSADREA